LSRYYPCIWEEYSTIYQGITPVSGRNTPLFIKVLPLYLGGILHYLSRYTPCIWEEYSTICLGIPPVSGGSTPLQTTILRKVQSESNLLKIKHKRGDRSSGPYSRTFNHQLRLGNANLYLTNQFT